MNFMNLRRLKGLVLACRSQRKFLPELASAKRKMNARPKKKPPPETAPNLAQTGRRSGTLFWGEEEIVISLLKIGVLVKISFGWKKL